MDCRNSLVPKGTGDLHLGVHELGDYGSPALELCICHQASSGLP
jgi:hypothetical protein